VEPCAAVGGVGYSDQHLAVPVAVIRAVAKRLKTAAARSPSVAKHYARFLVRATAQPKNAHFYWPNRRCQRKV